MNTDCQVCQSPATETYILAIDAKRVECPKCGIYSISEYVFRDMPDGLWDQIKSQLSLALRWKSDWGDPAVLRDGQDVMSVLAEYEGAQPSSRGESG